MKSSKNTGLSWGVEIFWERERSEDEEVSEWPGGLMRHGVDNVKHRPVGNPKRKV
jgi:hypothetical protein